jgi:hypothetical protein
MFSENFCLLQSEYECFRFQALYLRGEEAFYHTCQGIHLSQHDVPFLGGLESIELVR